MRIMNINNIRTIAVVAAFLACGVSHAKLVTLEDGESFRGSYQIEGTERDCGYNENIQNIILGEVNVFSGFNGVTIEPIVDNYSLGGSAIKFFDFTLKDLTWQKNRYVSSQEIRSSLRYKAFANDVLHIIERQLTVDSSGNLTLIEKSSDRDHDLVCHYTRMSDDLK